MIAIIAAAVTTGGIIGGAFVGVAAPLVAGVLASIAMVVIVVGTIHERQFFGNKGIKRVVRKIFENPQYSNMLQIKDSNPDQLLANFGVFLHRKKQNKPVEIVESGIIVINLLNNSSWIFKK